MAANPSPATEQVMDPCFFSYSKKKPIDPNEVIKTSL
jgi:hypothetical protein